VPWRLTTGCWMRSLEAWRWNSHLADCTPGYQSLPITDRSIEREAISVRRGGICSSFYPFRPYDAAMRFLGMRRGLLGDLGGPGWFR
jgi:hypothetical protein